MRPDPKLHDAHSDPGQDAGTESDAPIGDLSRQVALLIDADNVPRNAIGKVIAEIAKFGQPVERRAYGDFSGPLGQAWEPTLVRYTIDPRHIPIAGRGKNASDIALVIDAMDLLHGGALDAFCIVSSDSDFASLATRIREQHLECYVFGSDCAPERLRQACSRFILLENLKFESARAAGNRKSKPLRPVTDSLRGIRSAIAGLVDDPAGWVQVSLLERELNRRTTDFDARTYGHLSLKDLLSALSRWFVVDSSGDAVARVRMKGTRSVRKVQIDVSAAEGSQSAAFSPNAGPGSD
ncbi:hypothetical protein AU467_25315 [Mesorhizobium loti]|uniref:HTH OST-type domain-containing protein n=1 Tax=Rhizobium loti TaxID=381 RepID=A0A101KRK3_RHILI|nr:hypothetical protein AU467_25315 [Mesorhizobium loti]